MFTGIIEDLGKVEGLSRSRDKLVLKLSSKFTAELKKGDSVCVNGSCLTVTDTSRNSFTVDAVSETLSKTSHENLKVGDFVNLERAMKAGGRLDGHIVTGHVDASSIITNIVKSGSQTEIEITIPEGAKRYIVDRGSVAVDGVSLTIASTTDRNFRVAIIPHTSLKWGAHEKTR